MRKIINIGFVAYTIAAVLFLLDLNEDGTTVVAIGFTVGLFCSLVAVFMLMLQLFFGDNKPCLGALKNYRNFKQNLRNRD